MSKQNEPIESKMQRLRELTAWFESDEFSLDEANKRFTQAVALAKEIEQDLNKLKNTVVELKQSFDES